MGNGLRASRTTCPSFYPGSVPENCGIIGSRRSCRYEVGAVISAMTHMIPAIDVDTAQTDGTFIMTAEDFNTDI